MGDDHRPGGGAAGEAGGATKPETRPGVLAVHPPRAPRVPLVVDSPHSGLAMPPRFRPAVSPEMVRRAADTHVEDLFGWAPEMGAPLLEALFPRSFLDANRSERDVDPAMLDAPWPHPVSGSPAARRGMGLAWRYAWGDALMHDRLLTVAEMEARIEGYWRPYHEALRALLDEAHAAFGVVYHVNAHSMPARGHRLSPDPEGAERPDMVLGDRDGTSCEPGLTALAEEVLQGFGYRVARNDPFRGAELVAAYADPARGRHSLQIEVNRALYMDEETRERGPGYARLREHLAALGRRLAEHAASRGASDARGAHGPGAPAPPGRHRGSGP